MKPRIYKRNGIWHCVGNWATDRVLIGLGYTYWEAHQDWQDACAADCFKD